MYNVCFYLLYVLLYTVLTYTILTFTYTTTLHACSLVGRILGKALMDNQITPVHLIQPLYKHLMGWPVTFKDLEHIDDQVYRNLSELVNLDDVGCLYLEFVVTEDKLGELWCIYTDTTLTTSLFILRTHTPLLLTLPSPPYYHY